MSLLENKDDVKELVDGLNFKEKVDRSMTLIKEAYEKYDDGLVVANNMGKDSVAVWYLALNEVKMNPLYNEGYRSLGCLPCTKITNEEDERAGRWVGTSKCGRECGIHTRPLNRFFCLWLIDSTSLKFIKV